MRLSLRTEEAALAAFFDDTFFDAFVCDSALPADVFDLFPVLVLLSVLEAFLATLILVTFDFAILSSPRSFVINLPEKGDYRWIRFNSLYSFFLFGFAFVTLFLPGRWRVSFFPAGCWIVVF